MMTSEQRFWQWLRAVRHGLGWTQGQLAERAGLSRTMITMIETGKTNPSLRVLHRLVGAMGYHVEIRRNPGI